MKNKIKISIVLGIMCFALTAGICIQIKTVKNSNSTVSQSYTENNLRAEVLKYKERYDNKIKEIEKIDKELEEEIQKATENNSELSDAQEQIKVGNKILGLSEVKGPGVTITVKDSDVEATNLVDSSKYLVHDKDILDIVNELKNAGAEAISINDERIVLTTSIICGGNVININEEKIGSPFVIKAIGDSETIYGAITRNKGYVATLTKDGIQVDVQKSEELEISKTNKTIMQNVENEKNSVKKLKKIDKLIGNLSVSGSGVEITIDTSKTSDITAITLLQLINDLNSAGAEAISINDNRIVNMTDLMDINKEYILVDSNCIGSPYVIKAIGNISKLRNTMNLENSTISKLRRSGKDIEEKYKAYLKIDEYTVSRGKNKLLQKYVK